MTTTEPTTMTTTTATGAPPGPLARIGGVALGLAPVLLGLATVTSPPQESRARTDYVASLAADPLQTAISADLYHYAFVCFAAGALAVVSLVPGRRGRLLTIVLAVLTAFTSVQISGLVLGDFYLASVAEHADVATGAAVLGDLGPTFSVWLVSGQLAGLLVLLLPLGLARAGRLRWPVALLPLLSVALFAVTLPWPLVLLAQVALFAPYLVAARQLVWPGRGAARRAGTQADALSTADASSARTASTTTS